MTPKEMCVLNHMRKVYKSLNQTRRRGKKIEKINNSYNPMKRYIITLFFYYCTSHVWWGIIKYRSMSKVRNSCHFIQDLNWYWRSTHRMNLRKGKIIFMKSKRLNSVLTSSYAHCMNESVTVNVYDPRLLSFNSFFIKQ